MEEAGYDAKTSSLILESSRSLLAAYDYITIWRRGELDDGGLEKSLAHLGYSEESMEHMKLASLYYPKPDDLVRFAVREVFTPAVASKYGLNEDLPDEFLEASAKAGLSDSFAKQYWAAHWELPSVYQGFDMFHREIIDAPDLDLLLKTLDVMPYWREKLRKMSYNLVTRVDIRRLYKTRVYSETQVYDAYLHIGYSPEDAKSLTLFTVQEYSPVDDERQELPNLVNVPEKGYVPSKSMVMSAYDKGLLDRETVISQLGDLGYPPDASDLLVQIADDNLKQELIDLEADSITDNFRMGYLTEIDYKQELTALGVPSRYLELTVHRELAQAKKRVKHPSKSDLDSWIKKYIITPEVYTGRMLSYGYEEADINLYLRELLVEMKVDSFVQPLEG